MRLGVVLWFALAVALIVMGPFARTVWSHTDLQQENSYLAGMSDIALGCVAAWGTHRVLRRGHRPRCGLLALMQGCGWLTILAFATWPQWHWLRAPMSLLGRSGTDDTALSAAACLICASAALGQRAGGRWTAPIRWFGRHSYELYLSHEFVVITGVALCARWFPSTAAARPAAFIFSAGIIAVSALLAWALARYFSEPLNRRLRGAPLPT